MKRIIILWTLVAVLLILTWGTSWAQSSSIEADLIKVGYLMADGNDPNQARTLEGLTEALARLGLRAVVKDAGGNSSLYLEMIASLIAERIDVAVLSYLNDETTSSAVRTVRGVKIPVIVIGKKPLVEDYTASVTSNDDFGGYIAAYYIESFIKTRFEGGGAIAVIENGDGTASKIRLDGFMRAANEKGMKILSTELATDRTEDAVREFLKDENLRGIFATSDKAAIEASKTVFAEGRFNDVIVIGFGGQPEALEEIRKNRMVATVSADFKIWGRTAAGLAINAALGIFQHVSPKDIMVDPTMVSKSILTAESSIRRAEKDIEAVKAAGATDEDLSKVTAKLSEAKSLFETGSYFEAEAASEEAIQLTKAVSSAIEGK